MTRSQLLKLHRENDPILIYLLGRWTRRLPSPLLSVVTAFRFRCALGLATALALCIEYAFGWALCISFALFAYGSVAWIFSDYLKTRKERAENCKRFLRATSLIEERRGFVPRLMKEDFLQIAAKEAIFSEVAHLLEIQGPDPADDDFMQEVRKEVLYGLAALADLTGVSRNYTDYLNWNKVIEFHCRHVEYDRAEAVLA